jgi:uncharacterized protein YciI
MSEENGMQFFTITMTPTERWSENNEEDWNRHFAWLEDCEHRNITVFGGRINPDNDPAAGVHGLHVIRAQSREEAEEIAAAEPYAARGLRTNVVNHWDIKEGSLTLSVTLLTHTSRFS